MRKVAGNKGFTLLEALVALTILALSKLLQVSLYYDAVSTEQRNADTIASEILEELRGELTSTATYSTGVSALQYLTLTDPGFVQSSMNTAPSNCTGQCVESIGTYYSGGKYQYRWRVSGPVQPNQQPANTWLLYVSVGWSAGRTNVCKGTDPLTCPYYTVFTSFLVPGTLP